MASVANFCFGIHPNSLESEDGFSLSISGRWKTFWKMLILSKTLPPRKIYKIYIYISLIYLVKKLEKEKKVYSFEEKWYSKPSLFPRLLLEKWEDEGRGEERFLSIDATIPRLSMPVSPWVYPWCASLRRPRTLICSLRCNRFKAYWTAINRRQRDQESLLATHLSVIKRPTLISFPLSPREILRDS